MKNKLCLALMGIVWFCPFPSFAQYNTKKLLQEGKQELEQGLYVSSLVIFQKIAALAPNLYEPLYLMAKTKYHLEDYQGAEEDCAKAIALQPYIADIYDLYGMILIKQGKYHEAAEAYSKTINLDKTNSSFYFNRAYCYYAEGQQEKAIRELESIISRWPSLKAAVSFLQEIRSGKVVIKRFDSQTPFHRLPSMPYTTVTLPIPSLHP